jgi:hypothetical protein
MGHQSSFVSYSVRVSVGGCWYGIDCVGQERLGPWWCKRRERELERLASRVLGSVVNVKKKKKKENFTSAKAV